ncbi:MAG: type II toxin-antitoxin system VapC family toxin [Rhodocyclaceae bacterium]|nr:type II toxin-antitoxin system VapC family toxin [Rhodocyclaceae bacterium]
MIDTSALIRLFIPDGPLHPEIEVAFNRASSGIDVVLAPQLLLVEAASVLLRKRRRGELSSQELSELMQAMTSLPIRFCEHETLILSSCVLAETHGLTAYDALYLALAEQHGARLMTCDLALDKVAHHLGLT